MALESRAFWQKRLVGEVGAISRRDFRTGCIFVVLFIRAILSDGPNVSLSSLTAFSYTRCYSEGLGPLPLLGLSLYVLYSVKIPQEEFCFMVLSRLATRIH